MSECSYFKTCAICGSKVKNVESHLLEAHEINVEVKLLHFVGLDEFHKWKENIERKTVSRYVKQYGAKKRKDGRVVTYYHCHRDGNYVPKGRNKRSLKKIGSNKINGTCPSLIKAEQEGDTLRVRFVATHVGHTCDISRMALTASEKEQMPVKTGVNVPVESLGEIKNPRTGETSKTIYLAKKQDVKNAVQYSLEEHYKSDVGHCIQEAGITPKKPSQSSSNAKEVLVEEIEDLEWSKRNLTEQISKIILNIETVPELLAVEKFLKPLEKVIQNAKNAKRSAKDCLSLIKTQTEPPCKRVAFHQNLRLFSHPDHDHLYQSFSELPSQCKTAFIQKAKD